MSYSFNVRGATLALALVAASEAFAKVVEAQPVHAADQAPALAAAQSFADLLHPDESKDAAISMNGYVSCSHAQIADELPKLTTASVTVNVSYVDRN